MIFDFKEKSLHLCHNGDKIDVVENALVGCRQITPAFAFWEEGEEVNVIDYEFFL